MPGLPLGLCELLASGVGASSDIVVEQRTSGPPADGSDPFTRGEVELGFMCAPPFLALRRRDPPPVELLGVAPVFDDPRARGRPAYFAELVTRPDLKADSLLDLAGTVVGINDPRSLSGRHGLEIHLHQQGLGLDHFAEVRETGSHLASIGLLAQGHLDVATIDSNTLRRRRADGDPDALAVRPLATLGPHPIQPLVVSTTADLADRTAWRDALLAAARDPTFTSALRAHGCSTLVPIDHSAYDDLDRSLRAVERRNSGDG